MSTIWRKHIRTMAKWNGKSLDHRQSIRLNKNLLSVSVSRKHANSAARNYDVFSIFDVKNHCSHFGIYLFDGTSYQSFSVLPGIQTKLSLYSLSLSFSSWNRRSRNESLVCVAFVWRRSHRLPQINRSISFFHRNPLMEGCNCDSHIFRFNGWWWDRQWRPP